MVARGARRPKSTESAERLPVRFKDSLVRSGCPAAKKHAVLGRLSHASSPPPRFPASFLHRAAAAHCFWHCCWEPAGRAGCSIATIAGRRQAAAAAAPHCCIASTQHPTENAAPHRCCRALLLQCCRQLQQLRRRANRRSSCCAAWCCCARHALCFTPVGHPAARQQRCAQLLLPFLLLLSNWVPTPAAYASTPRHHSHRCFDLEKRTDSDPRCFRRHHRKSRPRSRHASRDTAPARPPLP